MPHLRDERSQILLDTDVLVVGGGASGVAAAVTAARQGARVTLLERYGFCGGGAVAGLSGTVCGMYAATEDRAAPPRQVVHGFLDDFVAAMEARGGLAAPVRYGKTYTRVHDPLVWREAADALLAEAGVQVLYHTVVVGALVEGDERVEGVVAYTKQGSAHIRAKVTVDASGDADVVAMAGLPSFIGHEGHVQNPTMIFRLMGVDTARFLGAYGTDTIMGEAVSALIRQKGAGNGYMLPRAKIWLFTTTRPGELLCNCTRVIGADGRELNTLYARDFTEAEIEGRRQMREYARFFRDHLAGCEDSFVNDTGVQVGVRQTRQARGVSLLRNTDILAGAKFADGIARSPWPIELHAGEKPRVEWLLDDVYEVPYGCFVPERGEGLLVAGRCLSAEHEAVASARVTAQCFSYGHAIGHAAAIAVRERIPPRAIAGADLRERLNRDGARLD
ncbi:Thiamine thiazole synthase [Methylobacterium crusticola]|uniref:Thiamine thiazole synthase n=1 Tax=Methylobacterium crusticola TaxID=1697972 RepID=A0ABQ4QWZ3_9HYPH|nr:FAD-dependent oxidoreductase [Methylobacterium crusticola]GJD49712.1 Thiamine thiazole synthase [Methylobacterium crusticola]